MKILDYLPSPLTTARCKDYFLIHFKQPKASVWLVKLTSKLIHVKPPPVCRLTDTYQLVFSHAICFHYSGFSFDPCSSLVITIKGIRRRITPPLRDLYGLMMLIISHASIRAN